MGSRSYSPIILMLLGLQSQLSLPSLHTQCLLLQAGWKALLEEKPSCAVDGFEISEGAMSVQQEALPNGASIGWGWLLKSVYLAG